MGPGVFPHLESEKSNWAHQKDEGGMASELVMNQKKGGGEIMASRKQNEEVFQGENDNHDEICWRKQVN